MATDRARRRCRERLDLLASSTLTREEFTEEAMGALHRTVGFDAPSCWVLADPASLLPTGHEITAADASFHASVPRLTALHQGFDAASDRATGSGDEPVATLRMSTEGDLASSQLWDECFRQHGIGDCFFVACRDRYGTWGWVNGSREASDSPFTVEDVELLQDVSQSLGRAMRRMATRRDDLGRDTPAPGVIIFDDDLQETSWTAEALRWVSHLPDGAYWQQRGLLPPAVYAVAGRLLAAGDAGPVRARIRTLAGTWVVLDGARLDGGVRDGVAITIREATADEVLDILCRAYALTPRETELLRVLVAGLSTRQLAERLFITPHTVQDHLKVIFDKVGVRSRRELVGHMTGQSSAGSGPPPGRR